MYRVGAAKILSPNSPQISTQNNSNGQFHLSYASDSEMGDISVREYIRWVPEEPSEPTSTIVLTTPKRLFVDLRVLKPTVQKHGDDAGGERACGVLHTTIVRFNLLTPVGLRRHPSAIPVRLGHRGHLLVGSRSFARGPGSAD